MTPTESIGRGEEKIMKIVNPEWVKAENGEWLYIAVVENKLYINGAKVSKIIVPDGVECPSEWPMEVTIGNVSNKKVGGDWKAKEKKQIKENRKWDKANKQKARGLKK